MKANQVREMTIEEMQRKVADLKQELFNLRFQHATGQLENQAKIRKTKKDIARLSTVMREVSLNPQPAKA
jgi:large subunit ribosomal protein L29